MDVILIPGFRLDASSWQGVTPVIEEAGHRVHPVTLPGLESVDADRSGIGLRDHIDAVVRLVDRFDEPVVLVRQLVTTVQAGMPALRRLAGLEQAGEGH